MNYLGDYAVGATVYVPFATYDSNGASVTITGLAVTDVEVYKDGSATQRASDAGYALLDTDGIDFDGITGIHGFSIDLSDNTDAGFYVAGHDYWVVVASVTCDGQTVNFVAATFSIENRSIGKSAASNPTTVAASMADAGASLSAVPWNGAWDAEVESEVEDAIVAYNLDHLCKTATDAADMTTEVADNTILSRVLAAGDTSAFDPATDGLQPTRDHIGNGTNLTEAGGTGDHLTGLVADATKINGSAAAAARLALSAAQIIPGTVDSTEFPPTATEFESDDITESTADHYNGRLVVFTSGDLAGQVTDVTDYAIASGRGHFTVTALTEAPADDATFVLV